MALNKSRVYPGVMTALRALEKKFRLGIVTTSPRPYAERAVTRFDLGLPVVVAYHDTNLHKPNPEPLLRALALMNLQPQESAYVGESPSDILAAHAAQMTAVAALWGTSDRSAVEALKPTFSLESPGGLPGLFA